LYHTKSDLTEFLTIKHIDFNNGLSFEQVHLKTIFILCHSYKLPFTIFRYEILPSSAISLIFSLLVFITCSQAKNLQTIFQCIIFSINYSKIIKTNCIIDFVLVISQKSKCLIIFYQFFKTAYFWHQILT